MKDYLNEIDSQFPARRTESGKAAFRAYVFRESEETGYPAAVAENETAGLIGKTKKHRNIVIGDPEKARVVFTAHYDTPRRSLLPNLLLPLNRWLMIAYLCAQIVPLLALAILAGGAARDLAGLHGGPGRLLHIFVYLAVYLGLYLLIYRCGTNPHNRNDNTSGVSCVLTLARRLAGDPRAAFILFDNEEKGKLGSRAYAAANPALRGDQLFVNMDCVGNGDAFILSAGREAMEDVRFPALSEALEGIGTKICPADRASLNSDQKNFKKGVGICACLWGKTVGYYTPRLHTVRDTVASPDNILKLSDALASFAKAL